MKINDCLEGLVTSFEWRTDHLEGSTVLPGEFLPVRFWGLVNAIKSWVSMGFSCFALWSVRQEAGTAYLKYGMHVLAEVTAGEYFLGTELDEEENEVIKAVFKEYVPEIKFGGVKKLMPHKEVIK